MNQGKGQGDGSDSVCSSGSRTLERHCIIKPGWVWQHAHAHMHTHVHSVAGGKERRDSWSSLARHCSKNQLILGSIRSLVSVSEKGIAIKKDADIYLIFAYTEACTCAHIHTYMGAHKRKVRMMFLTHLVIRPVKTN